MRIGEAYQKVSEEISQALAKQSGLEPGEISVEEIGISDLRNLSVIDGDYKPLLYDGSIKDFILARSMKRAQAMIDQLSDEGTDFTESAQLSLAMVRLPEAWYPDFLQLLALGYSFAAPEYAETPKTKEGFLALCRAVDGDLISIQVAQFTADEQLRDKIRSQTELAAAFTSQLFALMNKPINKFVFRDWMIQCWATVALNCFIAGHRVRDLLEEEAAFEAMMKEND